jgi:hypothetical protein
MIMKYQVTNKCVLLSERSQLKDCILYNSNHMTLWKRQDYGDTKGLLLPGISGRREELGHE